jgi:hypothetical protein
MRTVSACPGSRCRSNAPHDCPDAPPHADDEHSVSPGSCPQRPPDGVPGRTHHMSGKHGWQVAVQGRHADVRGQSLLPTRGRPVRSSPCAKPGVIAMRPACRWKRPRAALSAVPVQTGSDPTDPRGTTERKWARQGSNLRPLACKARALPLSYAPRAPRVGAPGGESCDPLEGVLPQAARALTASFQPDCSRTSPGWFTSAKATLPSASTRKVARRAMPAFSLNAP